MDQAIVPFSDLGKVLDALQAEGHQLAGLEGARHPLVRRVEVSLAEAAEVDVHLQIWREVVSRNIPEV